MKIAAVIAEYNPFHNGHLYQLNTIRSELGADRIIVLMSGDFVQRGEPAVIDKYARCEMALKGGADLVLELPAYFALGSAEYFAQGAVSMLDKLGVVDILHFGSECGDINALYDCAHSLTEETPEYKKQLNDYLKHGLSFPSARAKALADRFGVDESILSSPNNNLAVEYIKALLQRKSRIMPMTLERKGSEYNSSALISGEFTSANAVRNTLSSGTDNIDELKEFLPDYVFEYITQATALNNQSFMFIDDFSALLHYKLLCEQQNDSNTLSSYYDINEQFANTIFKKLPEFMSFSEFAMSCKSKNLTYTRISRCLMHIILDMKQSVANELKLNDYSQYARVLGFTDSGKDILKAIKSNSSIPIITKPSKALCELDGIGLTSFKTDINVTNIYHSVRCQKSRAAMPNELTRELILL